MLILPLGNVHRQNNCKDLIVWNIMSINNTSNFMDESVSELWLTATTRS